MKRERKTGREGKENRGDVSLEEKVNLFAVGALEVQERKKERSLPSSLADHALGAEPESRQPSLTVGSGSGMKKG